MTIGNYLPLKLILFCNYLSLIAKLMLQTTNRVHSGLCVCVFKKKCTSFVAVIKIFCCLVPKLKENN